MSAFPTVVYLTFDTWRKSFLCSSRSTSGSPSSWKKSNSTSSKNKSKRSSLD